MCPELLGQGSRPSLPSAREAKNGRRSSCAPAAARRACPSSVPEGDDHAIRRDCSRKLHKPITLVFQHK